MRDWSSGQWSWRVKSRFPKSRAKCSANCWKTTETSLTTVSFDQTAVKSTCWNCSAMNCSARRSTGCCSESCSIGRCCSNSAQPTSTTKRKESGYWMVADPSSTAVPTLDSATCSGQQMEIAVGPGRSSESLSATLCLEPARIQRSSRLPFRADRDFSSLLNSSC